MDLPSFLGYGPKNTAYGNVLEHAGMAAKQAYSPEREQQAVQKEQQEIQKEQLMNALRAMQNQYAPKRFEQEEEQLRLANVFNQARELYAGQIAQNEAVPENPKPGTSYIGEDGETYTVPTTETTTAMQEMQLANAALKPLLKVKLPYRGKGSILQLEQDYNNYVKTKDPKLAEKLIMAGLTNKLSSEQNLTYLKLLGAGQTVPGIAKQMKAIMQGAPETLNARASNLPSEISEEVERRFENIAQEMYEEQVKLYKNNFASKNQDTSNNNKNTYHPNYSDKDLIFTSKQTGKTIEEVIKILESKRRG